jgi:hypothetical protein
MPTHWNPGSMLRESSPPNIFLSPGDPPIGNEAPIVRRNCEAMSGSIMGIAPEFRVNKLSLVSEATEARGEPAGSIANDQIAQTKSLSRLSYFFNCGRLYAIISTNLLCAFH